MRFRKLRITWSVFWGFAGVLLIVLWVRSYWRVSILRLPLGPACCKHFWTNPRLHPRTLAASAMQALPADRCDLQRITGMILDASHGGGKLQSHCDANFG